MDIRHGVLARIAFALASHPLTRTDLDTERGYLADAGLRLIVATA